MGIVRDQSFDRNWAIVPPGIFSLEFWLRPRQFGTDTAGGLNNIAGFRRSNEQSLALGHQAGGTVFVDDAFVGRQSPGYILDPKKWHRVVITVAISAGPTVTDYKFEIQRDGIWTNLYTRTGVAIGFASPIFQILNTDNQNGSRWIGHVSLLGMYSLDAFGDSQLTPTGNVDPVSALAHLFAGGGASGNDGSPTTPWNLDAVKFADEVQYGIGAGDTVTVDSTAAVFDIGTSVVAANQQGAADITYNFLPQNRQTRKVHRDISGAMAGGSTVWTQPDAAGAPNIWSHDDGLSDKQKSIVYENGVALPNHDVGANFAAVKAALNAHRGMYVDFDGAGAGPVYVSLQGENPNTNGKIYSRSRDRVQAGTHNRCVFQLTNSSGTTNINGFGTQMMGYVGKADNNDVDRGSLIDIDPGCQGIVNINNADGDGTGKHFGGSSVTGGLTISWNNCTVGAGHPYCTPGSATTFADQCQDNTTTGAVTYNNITVANNADVTFYTAHGTAGFSTGRQASCTMTRVIAPGKSLANLDGTDGVAARVTAVIINNSSFGALNNGAGTTMTVTDSLLNNLVAGTGITLSNCEWIPTGVTLISTNQNQQVSGTINVYSGTVDVSNCTPGDANASLFYRTAAAVLTFIGSLWKDGGQNIALAGNFATGEITSDDNLIEKPVGSRWMENYNAADKTGTQWQALGFDTHSQFVADALAPAPAYRLNTLSAGRGLVSLTRQATLANRIDFNGRTRPVSGVTDAGAQMFVQRRSGAALQLMMMDDLI